jgi:hypothetical protein
MHQVIVDCSTAMAFDTTSFNIAFRLVVLGPIIGLQVPEPTWTKPNVYSNFSFIHSTLFQATRPIDSVKST